MLTFSLISLCRLILKKYAGFCVHENNCLAYKRMGCNYVKRCKEPFKLFRNRTYLIILKYSLDSGF